MVYFITKCVFLFAIIFASLDGIDCQFAAIATKLPQIITLLENVTDSSATMSSFLPHLVTLLQNQNDVKMLTNILLKNNTSTADEVASILPVIKEILQDQHGRENQVVTLLEDQQQNHNQTTTLLRNNQDGVNRIESTLVQMANTQTQMVNTFDQILSVLQMQSQQLENMTAKLTSILNVQNNILRVQLARDCSDIKAQGNSITGPYIITPQDGLGSIHVYCDMDTDGGGWTVFQRRFDGSVDFYRGWDEYEQGFGRADGEYWLGLQHIHRLTQTRSWTLLINLEAFDGSTAYAEYESFQVGDAVSSYTLSAGAFSGTAPNSLTPAHNNRPFSTKDRDHTERSCTQLYRGAWWYSECLPSNLNGLYNVTSESYYPQGMTWRGWPVAGITYIPLKGAEMKIRPVP